MSLAIDTHIGEAPLVVSFADASTVPAEGRQQPTITSRVWDFGDGATAAGSQVNHTYSEPGLYTVTLTVTTSDDVTASVVRRNTIVVLDTGRVEGTVPAEERTVAGIDFVWVPPGAFSMGNDPDGYDDLTYEEPDAEPQHEVSITHGFWLSKYEVRQDTWEAVMGENPSLFDGLPSSMGYPADSVSWDMCQSFVEEMNKGGQGLFRLPTEAEWEYACRAGTVSLFSFGNDLDLLTDYTASSLTTPYSPQSVGQFLPNPWGLHDMHGNLWEWTQDIYTQTSYTADAQVDPFGPEVGAYRAVRGGSYRDPYYLLTSVTRTGYIRTSRYPFIGMRLVLQ